MTCLSMPHSRMQLIRVAGRLGVRLPATPPPLPSPDGGGHHLPKKGGGPVLLCTSNCTLWCPALFWVRRAQSAPSDAAVELR